MFSGVLLAYQRSVDDPGRPVSPIVMIGCGAALWVHPIAAAFIGGLALTAALRSRRWRERGWAGLIDLILGRHVSGATRVFIVTLHVIVACEIAAFVWTYLGFRLNVGLATAAHPQKVFRMLAIASALTVVAHALVGDVVARGRALRALAWFGLGLLPVAFYVVRGGAPGSIISVHPPCRRAGVVQSVRCSKPRRCCWACVPPTWAPLVLVVDDRAVSRAARGPCHGDVARVAGRDSERTPARGCAGRVRGGLPVSPARARRRVQRHPVVSVRDAVLRVDGPFGRFRDPIRGASVAPRRDRASSACVSAAFGVLDVRWFATLHVDDSDRQIAACLEARGIRAATADYWIAYRMMFLADERVIVDPDVNARYQPYTEAVAAAPRARVDSVHRWPRDGAQTRSGDLHGGDAGGRGHPMRRGVRDHLGPLILMAGLAVVWTWPLARHLSTHVTGLPGDNYSFLWNLWWMRHVVAGAARASSTRRFSSRRSAWTSSITRTRHSRARLARRSWPGSRSSRQRTSTCCLDLSQRRDGIRTRGGHHA